MKLKKIATLDDKTMVENIIGTIEKAGKVIINKPGSKDKTRQRVLLKDDTGTVDVLVWGGNYTNDIVGRTMTLKSAMVSEYRGKKKLSVFDKNIALGESVTKASKPSPVLKSQPSNKVETDQGYIDRDDIVFDLSRLLVKCFDSVYKELKEKNYTDVPVQEVEKMAATVFLTINPAPFR